MATDNKKPMKMTRKGNEKSTFIFLYDEHFIPGVWDSSCFIKSLDVAAYSSSDENTW